jgi:hypothetical protein
MGTVAKQGQRITAQDGCAVRPVIARGQEIVAVAQELAPPVRLNIRRSVMVVQAANSFDPTRSGSTCDPDGG